MAATSRIGWEEWYKVVARRPVKTLLPVVTMEMERELAVLADGLMVKDEKGENPARLLG